MSLPPWFTSLYRLTLRSVSASALHQPRAVRSLRRLWRPVFEDAAHATKHAEFSTGTNAEAAESWLKEWQIRMDNTLSLLASSAQSRGLAHTVTRNLATLQARHLAWERSSRPTTRWNPSLSPDHPDYSPRLVLTEGMRGWEKEQATKRRVAFDRRAYEAIGEVVRMAEGRDRISFGRIVRAKRWT